MSLIGGGSDSDDIFLNMADSSSDDLSAFDHARDNLGEDADFDINSKEKLVTEWVLYEKFNFDQLLPSSWAKNIVNNEIDVKTANEINTEFGSLGVLVYS